VGFFATANEIWIHHYTPETKQQSKQWTARGETALKKTKTVSLTGKVMTTVFWDSHGILLIDYLEKCISIIGVYYAPLLDKLKTEIVTKRRHFKKKKVLLHQDTSAVAMAKIHELQFELNHYPSYSPNLTPSDFFLFSKLKVRLGGQKFSSNEEVIASVGAYFAAKDFKY
jgi:histone-lysine N-methyltransferase SETMAR